jgi:class 3 adenylate cyclase
LRPRKQNIACLFSDIRGFTEGSKDLDAFIRDSVLPNVKESTNAIEIYGGIPRKIGDLIFAYFDHKSTHLNLIRSILAGLEIARINEDQNADPSNPNIERYILISTGEAIVGNIGGFDSSVEITALGSPVNYLSRVDELTKHPKLRELLASSDLIICNTSLTLLHEIDVFPNVTSIDLSELGLSIRNFHEQTIIHTMRPTTENRQLFSDLYKRIGKSTGQMWNEDSSFAA